VEHFLPAADREDRRAEPSAEVAFVDGVPRDGGVRSHHGLDEGPVAAGVGEFVLCDGRLRESAERRQRTERRDAVLVATHGEHVPFPYLAVAARGDVGLVATDDLQDVHVHVHPGECLRDGLADDGRWMTHVHPREVGTEVELLDQVGRFDSLGE
jgi:hypothetical protein